MVIHVVLLRPKKEISSEVIAATLSHVQALQETIPGILDVQIGKNMSDNHQDYTYGFIMRFVDQNHLKAYAPHPAHRAVSEELVQMCHHIIDFDIEQ